MKRIPSLLTLTALLIVLSLPMTALGKAAPQVSHMRVRSENRAEYRLSLRNQPTRNTSVASVRERVYARFETQRIRRQVASTNTTGITRRTVNTARTPASVATTIPAPSINSLSLQEDVLRLVNKERVAEGLSALTLHPLLSRSAQRYAEWMAEDGFFSHTDPDGGSSTDRIRDTGYLQPPCDCAYRYVTGENLAKNQLTAAAVVKAWMDSPKHRANVLHPQFEEMGLGYKDGYWVQHFGGIEER